MSAMDDRLEILIGKFLDGEITPAEQQWLDEELQRNDQARELLGQMKVLHECGRKAVRAEVLDRGKRPEEILERIWQRCEAVPRRRLAKADGHLRFAAGVAAGFLLGLILHFVLVTNHTDTTMPPDQPSVAVEAGAPEAASPRDVQIVPVGYPRPVMRSLDWYSFTDQNGQQWLVEGVREGIVQPAVHRGDL